MLQFESSKRSEEKVREDTALFCYHPSGSTFIFLLLLFLCLLLFLFLLYVISLSEISKIWTWILTFLKSFRDNLIHIE